MHGVCVCADVESQTISRLRDFTCGCWARGAPTTIDESNRVIEDDDNKQRHENISQNICNNAVNQFPQGKKVENKRYGLVERRRGMTHEAASCAAMSKFYILFIRHSRQYSCVCYVEIYIYDTPKLGGQVRFEYFIFYEINTLYCSHLSIHPVSITYSRYDTLTHWLHVQTDNVDVSLHVFLLLLPKVMLGAHQVSQYKFKCTIYDELPSLYHDVYRTYCCVYGI